LKTRPKKVRTNWGRHPVAQPAGLHFATLEVKVLAFFQVAIVNQKCGLALRRTHAAPDFWDQQADVVIDAHLGAEMARRGK